MSTEKATFGAGCFWGVEVAFANIHGVTATAVGNEGGQLERPTYKDVCTDSTGHAEVVELEFDPAQVTYEQLLDAFFELHDPTTLNRQGPDWGAQYRSAIFYTSNEQRQIAERIKAQVDKSGKWARPVVTEITKAGVFYPAEEYHQDYLQKNPAGYNCHYLRS